MSSDLLPQEVQTRSARAPQLDETQAGQGESDSTGSSCEECLQKRSCGWGWANCVAQRQGIAPRLAVAALHPGFLHTTRNMHKMLQGFHMDNFEMNEMELVGLYPPEAAVWHDTYQSIEVT
ncbi:hypothetical protein TrVGV298_008752 [Trichoderma virens]|nr:hypothetical protein TrVGV298_008752 [Trichoderma virens]